MSSTPPHPPPESAATKPILTQAELETPRTAAEMLAWVDAAAERFNTKHLRAEARRGKHFAKELLEEARPMALFAQRYYGASPQVSIQHVLGNQNYDAIVTDWRKPPDTIQFLEATTTLMNYGESLRMELLSSQGHAPGYGRIERVGSRGKATIKAASIAQDHEKIRDEHLQRVQEAVVGKAAKAYQANTALIVGVDDYVPFREADDVAALDHLARTVLIRSLAGSNFRLLALEGSRHVHLCYALP